MRELSPGKVQILHEIVDEIHHHPEIMQNNSMLFFKDFLTHLGACFPSANPHQSRDDALWTTEDPQGVLDPMASIRISSACCSVKGAESAADLKEEGMSLMQLGRFGGALDKLTCALALCSEKSPYWACRAYAYQKLRMPLNAIRDASHALQLNPENARALRVRGTCRRFLGQYEASLNDLHAANRIDYDSETDEIARYVESKIKEMKVNRREVEQEERMHLEALKAQRNQAKAHSKAKEMHSADASRIPSPSSPAMPQKEEQVKTGGIPAFSGMESLLHDPDLRAALKDPELSTTIQNIIYNPMNAMQYLSNPKIAALFQKIMGKVSPSSAKPRSEGKPEGSPDLD